MMRLYLRGINEELLLGELPDMKSCGDYASKWFEFTHKHYGINQAVFVARDIKYEGDWVGWVLEKS